MLTATTRVALAVVGGLLVLAGLAAAAAGAGLGGVWVTIIGAAIVVALVVERHRYRSDEADSAFEPHGPGGGEPGPIEPRFRPTDELFVDPTTQHLMRVHVDPRTGERRYVAEG
ncbi:MAG TPA: hypothetical protein VK871_10755 [Candidatus Limnocylindrales bacterium]|jgi:hypothetical protein|nr:hypothetical protein [Candidatus Limnocylindrales bacterium]